MIRFGVRCVFQDQPIKFRNTTATALGKLPRKEALAKLSDLCLANADALRKALRFCAEAGIGCFRVNSQVLPLKTHPTCGYDMEELPESEEILRRFRACGRFAREQQMRTCFHPDQFVVLNSLRPEVVAASIRELEYQSQVAQWIGADVVNIHGGGVFGDKSAALSRFARQVDQLSETVRAVLSVENDDKLYTPADLLPVCAATGIPLVYDAHDHRCHSDSLSIEEATERAMQTWNREPLFHISSPQAGWDGIRPERHHDFISLIDFPACWRTLESEVTVEVEARAKEVAVLKLKEALAAE